MSCRAGDDIGSCEIVLPWRIKPLVIDGPLYGQQRSTQSCAAVALLCMTEDLMRTRGHSTVVRLAVFVLAACFSSALLAADPNYDVVIRNGKIVDGTGNPWFLGDVAVRRDRVVAIGRVPAGQAKREIDAKGLIV